MRVAITGAATGIGAATVAGLRSLGAEIVAFDITEPKDVDRWIHVDLSDPAAIDSAIADAQSSAPFDGLVNNAGLPPRDGLAAAVLAVNYTGLVRLTRGLEPSLKAGSSIVNTASRAGASWRENIDEVTALASVHDAASLPGFVSDRRLSPVRAYSLSKEAVIAWGIANSARLHARGLRVNSVSPAAVNTGILDDFAAAFGDRMTRNLARVGRPGTAGEVAEVILFLLSPASAWVCGQDITIDGGMSAMAAAEALDLSALI